MTTKHPIATENAKLLAAGEKLKQLCEPDAPKNTQRAETEYWFETVMNLREAWVNEANAVVDKERKMRTAQELLNQRNADIEALNEKVKDLSKQLGAQKDAIAQLRMKYEKENSRVPKDVIVPDSPVSPF